MLEGIDICSRHKILKWNFELDPDKWKYIDPDTRFILNSKNWRTIKYFKDDGLTLNEQIHELPKDSGGIYVFYLKPDIVPEIHRYIMYVGRAQRKEKYSLYKRCRTYARDTRPSVQQLREIWGKELYLAYLPLHDDELIKKVEKELIKAIIPPCNDEIYDYDVMPTQPAF